jgi:hypothetical protein
LSYSWHFGSSLTELNFSFPRKNYYNYSSA